MPREDMHGLILKFHKIWVFNTTHFKFNHDVYRSMSKTSRENVCGIHLEVFQILCI